MFTVRKSILAARFSDICLSSEDKWAGSASLATKLSLSCEIPGARYSQDVPPGHAIAHLLRDTDPITSDQLPCHLRPKLKLDVHQVAAISGVYQ